MSDARPQVTTLLARFILETKIEAIPENSDVKGFGALSTSSAARLVARATMLSTSPGPHCSPSPGESR